MIVIFKCKCGHVERHNKAKLDWKGHIVFNGKPYKPQCPICSSKLHGSILQILEGSPKSKCGANCINAKGSTCRCTCQGANHGTAYKKEK